MITAVLISIVFLWLCALLREKRLDADRGWEQAERSAADADRADAKSVEAFLAVVPLIEKSDWMTGRWKGQFLQLVELETIRNNAVDKARRVLWEIPAVKAHIRDNSVATSLKVRP